MLSYEGIFFDEEAIKLIRFLEGNHLLKPIDNVHCTFKYHPNEDEIFDEIVGKEFEIDLIGYGCDGQNSGFEIKLPNELDSFFINYEKNSNDKKIPHITVSLAKGAKAVNTAYLDFIPLSKEVVLKGKFGYLIKEGKKEFVSFEPYRKTKTK